MITKNYNNQPMTGLSEEDYGTLLVHLAEQVASRIRFVDRDEAHKTASDALANTWVETMTAREWLAAVGARLDVDTSDCVGV